MWKIIVLVLIVIGSITYKVITRFIDGLETFDDNDCEDEEESRMSCYRENKQAWNDVTRRRVM